MCTAKLRELETAFHSSEFYRLVVEATDDSLSRALGLFGVPGGVDISLRGRLFSPPSFHEVDGDGFGLFALGRRQHFRHLPTAVFVGGRYRSQCLVHLGGHVFTCSLQALKRKSSRFRIIVICMELINLLPCIVSKMWNIMGQIWE